MVRPGGYPGTFGLAPGTVEAQAFLDLMSHANQRRPRLVSIVANSIVSVLRDVFGNHKATARTAWPDLFIAPLMVQCWTFQHRAVVDAKGIADALKATETFGQPCRVIGLRHDAVPSRPRRTLPL